MTCPSRRSSTSATPIRRGPKESSCSISERAMLTVQLVSPERILYSGEATMVLCRTVGGGDIAFLTDHAPFIGALAMWPVKITTTEGAEEWFAVHGGFVEVSQNHVTLLSDVAELAA